MAGTIITDTIQTENTFLQLNVSNTRVATINASGIFSNTGGKIIGSDGTFGNSTIVNATVSANLNFDTTGTSGIRLPAANTLAFHTAGTEDMRISSTGDVNIGATTNIYGSKLGITSSSAFPFSVTTSSIAGIALGKTTDGAGNHILFTSNNSFNYGIIGVASANGTSTGDVYTLGYSGAGGSAATQVASWTSTGNFRFNSGFGSAATAYGCRAWVNFNGTGTASIYASGNISSVTDNSTGNHTVNFITAMPDARYAPFYCDFGWGNGYADTLTTTSYKVQTLNNNFAPVDYDNVYTGIIR